MIAAAVAVITVTGLAEGGGPKPDAAISSLPTKRITSEAPSTADSPAPSHASAAGRSVVLLGDSLAAGEGAGAYLTGTDVPGRRCHRSSAALFSGTGAVVTNAACSRAIAAHLTAPQEDEVYNVQPEPPQLSVLGTEVADITVIMVGGNDIRFAEIFNECVLAEADCTSAPGFVSRALAAAKALPGKLAEAYRQVASASPGSVVLVPAYPQLLGNETSGCGRISSSEAVFARNLTVALNSSIREAARSASAGGRTVHFIPDTAGSLAGHGACDPQPFVHTVRPTALMGTAQNPGKAQELLHPTATGYRDLTKALTQWLDTHPAAKKATE
ncbi:SGNH/GDSL hydrolase family protein [Arthrobacter sp. IA7]|uniref:SGNH/GDSL hydrolase family protein n=1 Tax=Arthrobacter ipis TaxID=2716202 RepID=UPI0016824BA3|nr:SGNH/GDSL hydrolase family protein [Arthrobacter ipis]MBD1541880.1 SGNH/GDSL hydrolase family protein [Arthrobacter ipis]